jgi:hypothetical protein
MGYLKETVMYFDEYAQFSFETVALFRLCALEQRWP